jgi:hypothetical protein
VILSQRLQLGGAILVLISFVLPWSTFQGEFASGTTAPISVPIFGAVMLGLALIPGPRRWRSLLQLIVAGACTVTVILAIVNVSQMARINFQPAWLGPAGAFIGIVINFIGAGLMLRSSRQVILQGQEENPSE